MTLYPQIKLVSNPPHKYRLVRLRPIGLGTADVESLSSYLTRLAAAHWVTPTNLYKVLSAEVFNGKSTVLTSASRLDGFSKLSRQVSKVIERTTVPSIKAQELTLLAWPPVFAAHGCGLLKPHLAWCPHCFQDDLEEGRPLYNRLQWSIRDVTVCLHHHVSLEHACHECGARQVPINANAQVGYCQQCGTSLVNGRSTSLPKGSAAHDAHWRSAACVELLAATQRGAAFRRETMLSQFPNFLKDYRGSPKRMAKSLNLPPDQVRSWVLRGHNPDFGVFLDFCYRLDVPPLSFFEGSGSLTINKPRVTKKITDKRARALSRSEVRAAREKIIRVLESPDDIHKIADLAQAAGLTNRQLQYHLPDEYSAIVNRIFERRAREKRMRDRERVERVRRHALSLVRRGFYPSQRKIIKYSDVRSSDLRQATVRAALREVQDAFLEANPAFLSDEKFMLHLKLSRRRMPTERELADQVRLQTPSGRLR